MSALLAMQTLVLLRHADSKRRGMEEWRMGDLRSFCEVLELQGKI